MSALLFRAVHSYDAEDVVQSIDASQLTNLQFFTEPVTLDREREYIERMDKSPADFLFGIWEDGNLIGTVGLHEIDFRLDSARLGIAIFHPKDRHQGFGKIAVEYILDLAFGLLGLNKVYCTPIVGGDSWEFFQHQGFIQEGVLRQEYRLDGKWLDLYRYSILKEEWHG